MNVNVTGPCVAPTETMRTTVMKNSDKIHTIHSKVQDILETLITGSLLSGTAIGEAKNSAPSMKSILEEHGDALESIDKMLDEILQNIG